MYTSTKGAHTKNIHTLNTGLPSLKFRVAVIGKKSGVSSGTEINTEKQSITKKIVKKHKWWKDAKKNRNAYRYALPPPIGALSP